MNAMTTDIPALSHVSGVPPEPPEAHQAAGELRQIPLKRLVASPFNMRRGKRTGTRALANNIAAVGMLQNLVVHPMKVGAKKAPTYGVAAGETRRLALVELVERGLCSLDDEVPCLVVSTEQAVLISLSENEVRMPPHPADQCDAYRALVDAGRTLAEIAEIYTVSVQTVQRRLKLARVSPKLIELFREDKIGADVMMALALSDSHAEQESAWFDALPYDRNADAIRRKLVAGERAFLNNRVALFVGTDAFEAAGGTVRRDLFSEQGAAWYSDQALMERVALEQLGVVAAEVLHEGWDWAEPVMTIDYNVRCAFAKMSPAQVAPTPEQQQEMGAIDARVAAIRDEQDSDDTDYETYERLDEEADALAERREAIKQSLYVYTPVQIAGGGVLVTIGQDGAIEVLRGWIKKADTHAAVSDSEDDDDGVPLAPASGASAPTAPAEKSPHSATLTNRLNARRTAAVSMALARQPHVALAALIHRFLLNDYAKGTEASALEIQWHDKSGSVESAAPELADDFAYRLHNEQRGAWAGVIPASSPELLDWCVAQTDERLLTILAQYVAASVNSISDKEDPHAINGLIPALGLNMAEQWAPTVASYFKHVSKGHIAQVVSEAVSPAEGMRLTKLKKADAATEAERLMAGRGWLPPHLARAEVRDAELWQLRRHRDDEQDDADDEGSQEDDDPHQIDAADLEHPEHPEQADAVAA